MRLKEIKPGMVIHCKTEEEANDFLHFLCGKGFTWHGGISFLSNNHFSDYHEGTCYKVYAGNQLTVGGISHFNSVNETVTEFSDLIIPELSAKEVLETLSEICDIHNCTGCSLKNCCPTSSKGANYSDAIEICTKWREEHPKEENKELETEWVYVVRIIKVHDNGKKECVMEIEEGESRDGIEDKIEHDLKLYIKNHKGNFFATLEHICRIKE